MQLDNVLARSRQCSDVGMLASMCSLLTPCCNRITAPARIRCTQAALFAVAPAWAMQVGLRASSVEPAAVAFMGVFSSYCVAAAGICACLKVGLAAGVVGHDAVLAMLCSTLKL